MGDCEGIRRATGTRRSVGRVPLRGVPQGAGARPLRHAALLLADSPRFGCEELCDMAEQPHQAVPRALQALWEICGSWIASNLAGLAHPRTLPRGVSQLLNILNI